MQRSGRCALPLVFNDQMPIQGSCQQRGAVALRRVKIAQLYPHLKNSHLAHPVLPAAFAQDRAAQNLTFLGPQAAKRSTPLREQNRTTMIHKIAVGAHAAQSQWYIAVRPAHGTSYNLNSRIRRHQAKTPRYMFAPQAS